MVGSGSGSGWRCASILVLGSGLPCGGRVLRSSVLVRADLGGGISPLVRPSARLSSRLVSSLISPLVRPLVRGKPCENLVIHGAHLSIVSLRLRLCVGILPIPRCSRSRLADRGSRLLVVCCSRLFFPITARYSLGSRLSVVVAGGSRSRPHLWGGTGGVAPPVGRYARGAPRIQTRLNALPRASVLRGVIALPMGCEGC